MLNRIILQGRLTDNPELKHTPTGKAVTNFSVAVEDSRTVSSERKVCFFKIEAWNSTAEFICKYFEKGQQILIEGKLFSNTYTDRNKNKRRDVFVLVDGVNFCGAKSSEAHQKEFEKDFSEDMEDIEVID